MRESEPGGQGGYRDGDSDLALVLRPTGAERRGGFPAANMLFAPRRERRLPARECIASLADSLRRRDGGA